MNHDPFSLWVAKAIADCGGNAAHYLRGVERKWALTLGATSVVDCQPHLAVFLMDRNSAMARFSAGVPTNLPSIH